MVKLDAVKYANILSISHLTRRYLSPHPAKFEESHSNNTWTIGGVAIAAVRIGNRGGVPESCTTWRYSCCGGDWSMMVRAVWRADRTLFQPTATHCQIESYTPDTPETRRRVNEWLHGVIW